MNSFTAKVRLKSDSELERITMNPSDYQDEFLKAVRIELDKREIDFEAPLLDKRLAKEQKIKEVIEYQKKTLDRLPSSIKWAANLIYLSLILRFVELIRVNLTIQVAGFDSTYILAFINFGLMLFIASTIRKGRDIRKLFMFVIFFSVISVLAVIVSFLTFGYSFTMSARLFASLCEILALILLYIDDSREWYSNEGKKF